MANHRVEKREAACMVDAVKAALAHLSQLKIHAVELGTENCQDVSPVYARVRRLRNYVEGCANSYHTPIVLDLSDEDADLLCACMVFEIGRLEGEAEAAGASEDAAHREWREEKTRLLADWSCRLATTPVTELPRRAAIQTPRVRQALIDVRKKFSKDDPGALFITGKVATFGGGTQGGGVTAATTVAAPAERPAAPAEAPAKGLATQAPSPGFGMRVSTTALPSVPAQGGAKSAAEPALLNVECIRDPRLRTMIGLDLSAWSRAVAAQDHRIAAVHLASVFEAAVIDYALPRSIELELVGSPDVWRLPLIVRRAVPHLGDEDVATLANLLRASMIVRPARQLREPLVVTSETLQQMRSLVRRVFVDLGLTTSTSVQP